MIRNERFVFSIVIPLEKKTCSTGSCWINKLASMVPDAAFRDEVIPSNQRQWSRTCAGWRNTR
jgi:hypothetical protein